MPMIAALFGNIWFRRVAAIGAVLLVLFMAKEHYIHEGKQQGREAAAQDLKTDTEKQVDQARRTYQQQVDQQNSLIAGYQAAFAASSAREQQSAQLAASLSGQRTAAVDRVDKIPQTQLQGYIKTQLALRPAGDNTPGYNPDEERALARCVSDQPLCQKQTLALNSDVQELKQEIKNLAAISAAQEKKLQSLGSYSQTVTRAYVTIYNAFPKKRNWPLTMVTFGAKGAAKKLPFPDPQDFTDQAEKQVSK